ncbi:uncharacterized protein LOC130552827 isoform X2 [Triplophysa rosa]|uniref:uncharacterized protein LOC130552827 isoform X2 n=1 Tax=Triplophysa rosa TaxID=992332 RepID=UPI002545F916|nr:uncharacterized protein LOC130552827 isoform X2 [Triplophysa rosa]
MLLKDRLNNSVNNSIVILKMLLGCRCALFVALICAVSGVSAQYVKVGGEVRFKPNPTLSSGSTITWKFKAVSGSVFRVIEFDHGESSTPQNPLFKDNAEADKNNGELTLKKLTKDHSGLYYFEINSKEQAQKFTLNVLEEVQQPELQLTPASDPNVAMYLECQYEATIIWKCTNKDTPGAGSLNGQKIGESIIFERTRNPDACCTCTLKNEVSEKTSLPMCERDIFPEESNAGLVAGILSALILILILICVFIALYLCWDSFHDDVHRKCGAVLCLGAMLGVLDHCRNVMKPPPADEHADMTTGEHLNGPRNTYEEMNAPQQPGPTTALKHEEKAVAEG